MTKDIAAEFEKPKSLGVKFRGEPKNMGPVTVVLFEDTCGNLINFSSVSGLGYLQTHTKPNHYFCRKQQNDWL